MKFSAATLSLLVASASAAIGPYESTNDVSDIQAMGADLDLMGDALGAGDLTTAKDIYENGSGSTTSFQSLSGQSPLPIFVSYYNSENYADEYIQAAFAGATFAGSDFSGMGTDGKEQIIKKGAAYLNAYSAAIESAQAAINACQAGDAAAASAAWDKAVALFYGESGEIVYAMGEKRCENFGTCGADMAKVNEEIFGLFSQGQSAGADCNAIGAAAQSIVGKMAVSLVQGVIRAAYKLDKEDGGEKELGYGTVFAAAVLPFVDACDAAAATTISSNMAPTSTSTDFDAVKDAFESTYDCMGITCADVNGLVGDDGSFLAGAEACGLPPAPAAETPAADPVAEAPAAEEPAAEEPAATESGASMAGFVASAALATAASAMLL